MASRIRPKKMSTSGIPIQDAERILAGTPERRPDSKNSTSALVSEMQNRKPLKSTSWSLPFYRSLK